MSQVLTQRTMVLAMLVLLAGIGLAACGATGRGAAVGAAAGATAGLFTGDVGEGAAIGAASGAAGGFVSTLF